MGKKPDEIDREIRQRRDQIKRRIEGLQGRVEQDLQAVRDDAQACAQQAVDDIVALLARSQARRVSSMPRRFVRTMREEVEWARSQMKSTAK